MFKDFKTFVNENAEQSITPLDSKIVKTEKINGAIYQLAKITQLHLQFIISDNNWVLISIPTASIKPQRSSERSNFLRKLQTALENYQIRFQSPLGTFKETDDQVGGSKQFIKVNFDDLVNFAENVKDTNRFYSG